MINVNQITSQLAKMPDQALQQFAAMHKSDPYTLSLAVAESNRRKELRAAAQAQLTAPPPPKVADQAVAGMAALPAPNMQIPDGGIAGYATGGMVSFDGGGVARAAGERTRQVIGNIWDYSPAGLLDRGLDNAFYASKDAGKNYVMPFIRGVANIDEPTPDQQPPVPGAPTAVDKYNAANGDELYHQMFSSQPPPQFQMPQAKAADQGGVASLSASMSDGAGGGGGGGAIPSIPTGDYQSLINARRARTDKEIADFKAANAGAGQAYADAEATAERKKQSADEDYKYGKGLALLQMAAKMGTTPGTFLTALATGVQSGLPQLALAKKEQSQAQDAVDKLLMTAHEARRAESRGDAKTMLEINSRAADQLDTIQMHGWTAQQEAATQRAKMETERDIAANHDATIRSGYSLRAGAGTGRMAQEMPMERSLVQTINTLEKAIINGQGDNATAPLAPEQLQQMQLRLDSAKRDLMQLYRLRAGGAGGQLAVPSEELE